MFSCVLGCVFLHCYFGMYLLRGISTPARPRSPVRLYAPLRAPARLRFLYAPVRAPALPISAPWALLCAVASPRRAGALLCAPWVSLVALPLALLGFPARLRCLPLLRFGLPLFSLLLHALGCAWLRFCIVFCMALLAFLLRKALALSFIHISAFCIIFILSNACAPKTFLYKSYI